MSYSEDISALAAIFGGIDADAPVYHYWRFGEDPPYVVWYEAPPTMLFADGSSAETAPTGFVHLFTQAEGDPTADAITAAMDAAHMTWYVSDVQYEDESKLVHITWGWSWCRG